MNLLLKIFLSYRKCFRKAIIGVFFDGELHKVISQLIMFKNWNKESQS